MPLPEIVTPNFSRNEIERASSPIPDTQLPNVLRTIGAVQAIRSAVGVPLSLTSLYRNEGHNKEVGGVATSDHTRSLAADFEAIGIDLREFYRRFLEADRAGKILPYDQLIVYPTTGEIHLGLGERMRRQHLVKINEKEYRALTSLSQIPKGAAAIGVVAVLVLIAITYIVVVSFKR